MRANHGQGNLKWGYLQFPLVFVELYASLGHIQDIAARQELETVFQNKTDLGCIPASINCFSWSVGAKLTLEIFKETKAIRTSASINWYLGRLVESSDAQISLKEIMRLSTGGYLFLIVAFHLSDFQDVKLNSPDRQGRHLARQPPCHKARKRGG